MKKYKSLIKEKVFSVSEGNKEFIKAKINCSRDINEYVRQFYFDDISIFESFFIVLLNSHLNTIGYAKISQGGTTQTLVDPKLVAKYAIDTLACSVILCHNHPSGNITPSQSDKDLTNKIKDTLEIFNCKVLDHIIITPDPMKYYSFADEGII